MDGYVYFCKNCRSLVADQSDNRLLECEGCGGEFRPLHVTVSEWNTASSEERNDIVKRAEEMEKSLGGMHSKQKQVRNSKRKMEDANGSEDGFSGKIRRSVGKITAGERGKISKLSIVGFILSFLGFFSLLGLTAGIVDLIKKDGRKKGLSIATICVSIIVLLISIGLSGSTSDNKLEDSTVAETTTEDVSEDISSADNAVEDIIAESATEDFSSENGIVSDVNETNTPAEEAAADADDSDLIDVGADSETVPTEDIGTIETESATRTLYTTTKVNIREQPNTDCSVLGKAEAGQEVTEYEAGSDGWSRVSCSGVEGYIKSEYLTQEKQSASTNQNETTVATAPEPTQAVVPTSDATSLAAAAVATAALAASTSQETMGTAASVPEATASVVTGTGGGYVVNGKNGKIHIVGGCSTPPTEDPRYCQTYEEAEAISISVAPEQKKRRCGNCYK